MKNDIGSLLSFFSIITYIFYRLPALFWFIYTISCQIFCHLIEKKNVNVKFKALK